MPSVEKRLNDIDELNLRAAKLILSHTQRLSAFAEYFAEQHWFDAERYAELLAESRRRSTPREPQSPRGGKKTRQQSRRANNVLQFLRKAERGAE